MRARGVVGEDHVGIRDLDVVDVDLHRPRALFLGFFRSRQIVEIEMS